jgi:hypothetical protein
MENKAVKIAYACKGVEESVTFRFLSFDEPTLLADGSVSVGGITVKCASGLTPNLKKIEYLGHINLMSMKNYETIYALDYTVVGQKDLEAEFEFVI